MLGRGNPDLALLVLVCFKSSSRPSLEQFLKAKILSPRCIENCAKMAKSELSDDSPEEMCDKCVLLTDL